MPIPCGKSRQPIWGPRNTIWCTECDNWVEVCLDGGIWCFVEHDDFTGQPIGEDATGEDGT